MKQKIDIDNLKKGDFYYVKYISIFGWTIEYYGTFKTINLGTKKINFINEGYNEFSSFTTSFSISRIIELREINNKTRELKRLLLENKK